VPFCHARSPEASLERYYALSAGRIQPTCRASCQAFGFRPPWAGQAL